MSVFELSTLTLDLIAIIIIIIIILSIISAELTTPTFTGSVENGSLKWHVVCFQLVIHAQLDGVTRIRIDVRQGQEVRRPYKGVAVVTKDA